MTSRTWTDRITVLFFALSLLIIVARPADAHWFNDVPPNCGTIHQGEGTQTKERQRNWPLQGDSFQTESYNHVWHEHCLLIHLHYLNLWTGGGWYPVDPDGWICGIEESPSTWNPNHTHICNTVWRGLYTNATWSSSNNVYAVSSQFAGYAGVGGHWDLDWAYPLSPISEPGAYDCWRRNSDGSWTEQVCQIP